MSLVSALSGNSLQRGSVKVLDLHPYETLSQQQIKEKSTFERTVLWQPF